MFRPRLIEIPVVAYINEPIGNPGLLMMHKQSSDIIILNYLYLTNC